VLVLAVLPVVRRLAVAPASHEHCCFDGLPIDPRHRVRIATADDSDNSLSFCSIGCAEGWVRASGASPRAVYVTDEPTGSEIDIRQATIVQSRVVVHAGTGDRRHVFRRTTDAASHAAQHQGRILAGKRRPFSAEVHSADGPREATHSAMQ
jgi:hypothetical protein